MNKLLLLFLDVVIVDVIQGDSGNYTCEIEGPQNTILSQTTHFVYVRG